MERSVDMDGSRGSNTHMWLIPAASRSEPDIGMAEGDYVVARKSRSVVCDSIVERMLRSAAHVYGQMLSVAWEACNGGLDVPIVCRRLSIVIPDHHAP